MAKEYKTQRFGTYTAEGWIPHKPHPITGILMPVKVRTIPEKISAEFPELDRKGGRIAYVLPSGGLFLDH